MTTYTTELLQEMARLTALSGRICDVQEHNLKMFPLVFFNHVDEVKVDYDLMANKSMGDEPTNSNSLISYYISTNDTSADDLDKRFKALENAVRTLFWSDVKVEVYFNNKIVYKSPKNG